VSLPWWQTQTPRPPTTIHVAWCPVCLRPLMVATPGNAANGERCGDHLEATPLVERYQLAKAKERSGRKPRKAR